MNTTDTPKNIHQGRNVKRFREMLGLKQEALAIALGEEWSQKRVSLLESKETLEPEILSQVAKALKVPEDSIKNFDEEAAINIINSTFTSNDNSTSIAYQPNFTFNPIDKLVELFEENKKLYERLLQSEQEKVEILKDKHNK
ncbi:helix-turn-helix transcriptional regulator [Mucilaginibacter rubeus]|uniref:Helix-turn-helix transcriptional regulator n=1 Tax=Mucilaginibacter rubeus TaxID=2027860 RepID=A0AAE6JIG5_9SPHI|nr:MULTISPECIES: helix-turn-helix transcriptional regulator [Mucilaginibacter]QEM05968.1 helix-turn-helix transcriptional regulator [Mucilaginibacter rubeus]QEM18548.1 helix-turn-helix transcriptional regulator [Mucilaginibacter gossypii]QTE44910.1 helix-turn-helix transcriptional regulator [Mucilaginibacter rubeus]QTE51508.1 helix-turn-helix transcriptional regulator [Mucilaginibacter rubeus]QTE56594.1 helix-turn-helix transcriptional regulator [Mucilaginibacter rubeus]